MPCILQHILRLCTDSYEKLFLFNSTSVHLFLKEVFKTNYILCWFTDIHNQLWYDFSSGQLFGLLQTVICLLISHINNIMGYWKFDSMNIWSVAMFSLYILLQQIFMWYVWCPCSYINGLVQERRNSSALVMELVSLALTHRYVAII